MRITLCGSLKFEQAFKDWSRDLTLSGHVPYSVSVYPSDAGGKDWYKPEQKVTLDLMHLAKIDNSDAIAVLNVDGYVGESTIKEVAWARIKGKPVFWLMMQPTANTPSGPLIQRDDGNAAELLDVNLYAPL